MLKFHSLHTVIAVDFSVRLVVKEGNLLKYEGLVNLSVMFRDCLQLPARSIGGSN